MLRLLRTVTGHHKGQQHDKLPQLTDTYSAWNRHMTALFSGHYLCNRSTLDIGVLGYIGIF
jgi:hypothetical protein